MDIYQKFLTENDCFKQNKKMTPRAIMVHSTATPGVKNERWFSLWNKSGVSKAVHAFIDETGVMQTLPWDTVGWHSGVGSKGKSANANNNGYIGFEICEPAGFSYSGGSMAGYDEKKNAAYFNKVYAYAVELCIFLCRKYGISPENIICHSEGHTLGIASNHSDVMQWFPKHGKSMDTFRADVKKGLGGNLVMRTFILLEEMNFRKTPNGTKIGIIPGGTTVSGETLAENNGVYWLFTRFDGKDGYVAVLPESRKYAREIVNSDTDYKSAYEAAQSKLDAIKKILE